MKPFVTIFSLFILIFQTVRAQYDFGFSIDAEIAQSVNEGLIPPESQSFFTVEQNWTASNRKMKALFQGRLLSYSYEVEKARVNQSEVYPVDAYLEFQPSSQRISLGYQHIFLTEGFDSVGMELINPRNLNTTFFLDADKKSYTVPALNYRFINDLLTIQFVHVFQFRGDESNAYVNSRIQALNPGLQFQKIESKDSFKKNDQVLRLLKSVGQFDFSLGYLKTYEKNNQYLLNLQTLKLESQADPFTTLSLNVSGDLSGLIIRFDYLLNQSRKTVMTNGQYQGVDVKNLNLGLEHDFVTASQIALNYSRSDMQTDLTPTFRKKSIEDFYIRWSKSFTNDLKLELLLLQRLSDKGQAVNLKASLPLSPLINVKAGLETFGGEKDSEFLQAKDFSRIYAGLFSTVF